MASSTTNKKEIVDFLWDWAGTEDWKKLLINKIVNSENSLEQVDRKEVFNYFLQSIGLKKRLPELKIVKPSYSPNSKEIKLSSLSEVKGVNKLAKNQTINFSPNLTVIYGENGTGKTGYGRILKALGFSYDRDTKIYPNVFQKSEPQTAKIKYTSNGNEDAFDWTGNNRNKDLESISVFNNNCVQISLDGSRQLIVSPIGFHLFNLVSSELVELESLLEAKTKEYPIEINWLENLNVDTPQQQFLTNLSKDSSEEKLKELSSFGEVQEKELSSKTAELSKLNKQLLQNEIRSLKSQIAELISVIGKIDHFKTVFNAENWKQLIDTNKTISELEKTTQKGISEIAEAKGIEFYETDQFKSFLSAAEAYIKRIDKPQYPNEDDVCVYCQQPLEKDAKELLINYRRLLNDKTEEKIASLKQTKKALINKVKEIDTSLNLNHPSFGLDTEEKPVQPTEFEQFNKEALSLKNTFINDEVAEDSIFILKYDVLRKFVSDKQGQIQALLQSKIDSFKNIETKENELKKKIAELKDRKLLSGKLEEVKKIIANHKIVTILDKHSNSFNTSSISRKTSQARQELVSQNFNNVFQKELKALRKSNLPVELSFGTDRGTTKLNHKISDHQLLEILSEGEQKAIALSEFLTELQLDNIKAPVIFDDPVNSLDHKIIDSFAKRVIRLSEDRQVVIFTHSVLLFNSLLYLSGQPNFKLLEYKFYNSQKDYEYVGVISEAEEEKNKVKERITKINTLINNTQKDRSEVDVAKEGFGELRSAIELCIEHEIFKGTVKRYQKNISLTNFIKVDSDKINEHKEALNDIFERSCGYIGAHSNPEAVYDDPTFEDLKSDFDEFIKIRKEFI